MAAVRESQVLRGMGRIATDCDRCDDPIRRSAGGSEGQVAVGAGVRRARRHRPDGRTDAAGGRRSPRLRRRPVARLRGRVRWSLRSAASETRTRPGGLPASARTVRGVRPHSRDGAAAVLLRLRVRRSVESTRQSPCSTATTTVFDVPGDEISMGRVLVRRGKALKALRRHGEARTAVRGAVAIMHDSTSRLSRRKRSRNSHRCPTTSLSAPKDDSTFSAPTGSIKSSATPRRRPVRSTAGQLTSTTTSLLHPATLSR